MTHTEDGALEGVLIAASVVFGVCAIAAKLLALWLWNSLEPQFKNDSAGAVSAKMTRLNRQISLVYAGVGLFMLAFVAAATILKIGSPERDGHVVNWLYLAIGESVAFGLLGMIFSKFMWFDKDWQAYLLSGAWAAWPVLLGTASLLSSWDSRLFLFLVAGGVVLASAVFMFLASGGMAGPMVNNRGGLVGTLVLVCSLVLYFVYWYIGFMNRGGRPGVSDNTRWHTFIAWFFAGIGAHVVVPAILLWCFEASDLHTSMLQRQAVLTQDDAQPLASYEDAPQV